MTDRERFEAWHHIKYKGRTDQFFEKDAAGEYVDSILRYEFYAYQAATAAAEADKWAAVRRCAEIVDGIAEDDLTAARMSDAIKAEFAEAWK